MVTVKKWAKETGRTVVVFGVHGDRRNVIAQDFTYQRTGPS